MKYQLKCLKTNSLIEDNYTLHYSDDALLQTKYQQMLSKTNIMAFGNITLGFLFLVLVSLLLVQQHTKPQNLA